MKSRHFAVFFSLAVMLSFSALPLRARDYFEPLAITNPLYKLAVQEELLVGAGFFGRLWYDHVLYSSGGDDAFTVGVQGASRALAWGSQAAVQVHFASILVVGPVAEEEDAASIAEWWMNAVQYQYGLHAAVRSPLGDILGGYRRTSLHPLRRAYSEISRDQLFVGIYQNWGKLDAAVYLRYSDMWDFWGSKLVKPRNLLTLELTVSKTHTVSNTVQAFWEIQTRFHANRIEPQFDIEPGTRLGLRFGSNKSWLDVYAYAYHTVDSEQYRQHEYATSLFGLGVSASGL